MLTTVIAMLLRGKFLILIEIEGFDLNIVG